jgi:hypothetical protein
MAMTGKKLQLIAQTLLLVFLPVFVVMRPVFVSVENTSPVSSAQKSFNASYQEHLSGHVTFRSIVRENVQVPVLTPYFSRTILVSSEGRSLQFISDIVSFSPESFHVLRI